jgi:carboxyvinyl-carboxyphosphonate phosphorylmutase
MTFSTQRASLRKILGGARCITMASMFDPISARLAEQPGFRAALMGGSLASYVVVGAPDVYVVTLTELAEQVHRCTRVSRVPLVVDGDHGYGNALSVMRTVQEMDHAGAAAITIEDTLLPRPYGPMVGPGLVSFEESVGKIRAAIAARGDSDLLVLGRTGAASITGIEDAIARFKAFEAAGADALFVPGPKTHEELDRISAAVKLPLIVAGASEALCDPDYLASRRVVAWSAGHHTFLVALKALYEAMEAVKAGTLSSRLKDQAPAELINRATDAANFDRWTKEFLGGAQSS